MALIAHSQPDAQRSAEAAPQLLDLEAHQYYHIQTALEEEIGAADARSVLAAGLRAYGAWRGQRIVKRHSWTNVTHTLTSLVTSWGSADLHGVLELGWGSAVGDDTRVEIAVADTPDVAYLTGIGRRDLALLWWDNVLRGVAEAYFGDAVAVTSLDSGDAVTLRLEANEASSEPAPLTSTVFADAASAQRVVRETVDNRAAQLAVLGRAMITSYDASGEHALRVGIQRFGAERGQQLRHRHIARGTQPNLKHMIDDFDYGGESVWKFRDGGELTPQRWHQDCTFCPFAIVWHELDAMDLGYIYDLEFHVAQFKAYHPGIRVRWDKLQTRGDTICEFRFDLPDAETEQATNV